MSWQHAWKAAPCAAGSFCSLAAHWCNSYRVISFPRHVRCVDAARWHDFHTPPSCFAAEGELDVVLNAFRSWHAADEDVVRYKERAARSALRKYLSKEQLQQVHFAPAGRAMGLIVVFASGTQRHWLWLFGSGRADAAISAGSIDHCALSSLQVAPGIRGKREEITVPDAPPFNSSTLLFNPIAAARNRHGSRHPP